MGGGSGIPWALQEAAAGRIIHGGSGASAEARGLCLADFVGKAVWTASTLVRMDWGTYPVRLTKQTMAVFSSSRARRGPCHCHLEVYGG